MADQITDVPVPADGWEKPELGPFDDRLMLADLFGRAPGWVYDLAAQASKHESDLRMHPGEYRRLVTARWVRDSLRFPDDEPDWLMGIRLVTDPGVPEGVVRIVPGSQWTTPGQAWIAPLGTALDDPNGWLDVRLVHDYREHGAPTPDTRLVTMRHYSDPITVQWRDTPPPPMLFPSALIKGDVRRG